MFAILRAACLAAKAVTELTYTEGVQTSEGDIILNHTDVVELEESNGGILINFEISGE